MYHGLMIKAFGRAALITFLLILVGVALWHYTIITLSVIALIWLTAMFYMDPPERWDH